MELTNLFFILIFLPFCVFAYYITRGKGRPIVVAIASLLFYGMGSPQYFVLFVLMAIATFGFGRILFWIRIGDRANSMLAKLMLAVGIILNICPLLYYKYTDFVLLNLNRVFHYEFSLFDFSLPMGISFFTFKSISFLIDIYVGTISKCPKVICCMSYLSFFGQIVSGPLTRYNSFENLEEKKFQHENLSDGIARIVIGLGKKVILADLLGRMVNEAFANPTDELSSSLAWLGALAFSLELFFDFSGYSDMAIGIAKLFGLDCGENFNYPYMSGSVSEFWRRWHISLGEWFKDYIYIPLGGSRVSSRMLVCRNLFAVWMLTGIWHGASWNYVIWGLLNFVMVAMEKMLDIPGRAQRRIQQVSYRVFVLLFFVIQWVIFRANGIKHAIKYLLCMFVPTSNELSTARAVFMWNEYIWVFMFAIVMCFPMGMWKNRMVNEKIVDRVRPIVIVAKACMLVVVFGLVISFVIAGENNPFTYGNF